VIDLVADLLACPHCPGHGSGLAVEGRSLRCPAGHSFDIARQGYVNLLGHGSPRNADTAAMVAARERFLATGAYAPIRAALAERCAGAATVIEAGAGPGWYLAGALARPAARGLACDVSVPAVRRAARADPRIGAIVADTWAGLPVLSGVADRVLAVFAPRNMADFARILRPDGQVVVVVPGAEHLGSLRQRFGLLDVEPHKGARLLRAADGHLDAIDRTELAFDLRLEPGQVADLIAMGPNAFHQATDSAQPPEPIDTRVAVEVWVFGRV